MPDPDPSRHASESAPIDRARVRRLFAVPERVAEADFLRREIVMRMHERLALVRLQPKRVLDAGCGGGADLGLLQERYPDAQVVGLDGAPAMLACALDAQRQARSTLQRLWQRVAPASLASFEPEAPLLCGDLAELPLKAASFDLIWSNLALHWHPDPEHVFAEWRRVLKVDGLLMFSCFGPDTFKELRAAFADVDGYQHVLPFVDMHDFGDMLAHAGFATPVMDMETVVVTYDSVEKLLADVRASGGNPLLTRRKGLVGRGAWQRLVAALERTRRPDGKLHLTHEVIYGHAFRPVPRTTASGEAVIRFDLPKKRAP